MLVLQRRVGESIEIGENIKIYISKINFSRDIVSVGIEAPKETKILRSELTYKPQNFKQPTTDAKNQ